MDNEGNKKLKKKPQKTPPSSLLTLLNCFAKEIISTGYKSYLYYFN